jgi:hypothetical protein
MAYSSIQRANRTAVRAAENMRNLRTREEKRELAHELCRYYKAILAGHTQKVR